MCDLDEHTFIQPATVSRVRFGKLHVDKKFEVAIVSAGIAGSTAGRRQIALAKACSIACRSMLHKACRCAVAFATTLLLAASTGVWGATEPDDNPIRQIENPVVPFVRVQVLDNIVFGIGPFDRTQNSLPAEVLYPIGLHGAFKLIPRARLGLVYQPDVMASEGGDFGLSDLASALFLEYEPIPNLLLAGGPTVIFPTATNRTMGMGKWLLGPDIAVVYALPPLWVFSLELSNLWSIAGDDDRRRVNLFQIRPTVGRAIIPLRGLYVFTAPAIVADWTAKMSERWIVPIGGGAGFPFVTNRVIIDASVQSYWFAKRPAGGPDLVLQLGAQIAFLGSK